MDSKQKFRKFRNLESEFGRRKAEAITEIIDLSMKDVLEKLDQINTKFNIVIFIGTALTLVVTILGLVKGLQ
jgi:hypothetical protein